MKTIHFIGGARPNFIKIAPLLKVFEKEKKIKTVFINTGQHYDKALSENIIKDLGLRKPDLNLGIGSDSHINQISKVMIKYEKFLKLEKPNLVIVFGDVNSTIAAALTAKKNGIKVAHVEAGLRCYDDELPEEINRRLTDSISDILFTPSLNENKNLEKENIKKNVFFVGNIMIDSLVHFFKKNKIKSKFFDVDCILTLHRPENVDDEKQLRNILKKLKGLAKRYKILFPIHPRTKKNLEKFNLFEDLEKISNLILSAPLSYSEFLIQLKASKFIITDSGGIQEESSFLQVPCYTLRKNTERPITISMGTNKLVKLDSIKLLGIRKTLKVKKIPKWDGKTSQRILKVLKKFI